MFGLWIDHQRFQASHRSSRPELPSLLLFMIVEDDGVFCLIHAKSQGLFLRRARKPIAVEVQVMGVSLMRASVALIFAACFP